MAEIIHARMFQKHGTAQEWRDNGSFIPGDGEIIVYDPDGEYAYSRIKIGDGHRSILDLPFVLLTGTKGEKGETGAQGIQGVSIVNVEIDSNYKLKIFYSNGQIEVVDKSIQGPRGP